MFLSLLKPQILIISYSLLFHVVHFLFISYSILIYFLFISYIFISYAFLIHFLFNSYAFPIQFLYISYSIPIHFQFISFIFPFHVHSFLFISFDLRNLSKFQKVWICFLYQSLILKTIHLKPQINWERWYPTNPRKKIIKA